MNMKRWWKEDLLILQCNHPKFNNNKNYYFKLNNFFFIVKTADGNKINEKLKKQKNEIIIEQN